MDRIRALMELPVSLATALRLRDADAGHDVIATALGIDPHGVGLLLRVADAKLQSLMGLSDPDHNQGG
ncbi:MAG: hypothetical protein Q8K63_01640, partial [Acidimicrobiales bacterium]|nr:hypothetical protein [Acidimicrobiales bacterium]